MPNNFTKLVYPRNIPNKGREEVRFLTILIAFKAAISNGELPSVLPISFMQKNMRLIGIWPVDRLKNENPFYAVYNFVVMTLFGIFLLTITCDLHEASKDIIVLGDDLVQLFGLYLIYYKIWIFRFRLNSYEILLDEMTKLHSKFSRFHLATDQIRRIQRYSFIFEMSMCFSSILMGLALSVAIFLQPLVSHQSLPFRAKFPYELENPSKHPYCHAIIYVLQCVCTFYALLAVIFMDSQVCSCFAQITVNIKILCIRLRTLKANEAGTILWNDLRDIVEYHQHICKLTDDINECSFHNYIAQMGASTLIICLTAFEALVAKDQPMVALKFQLYMFCAFAQLFYWCFSGNRAYFSSLEIANAAHDVHEWYFQHPKLQRNLMFLIQRAQKPVEFRAKPLTGFNFNSFGSILSASYSYFALLRTMNN